MPFLSSIPAPAKQRAFLSFFNAVRNIPTPGKDEVDDWTKGPGEVLDGRGTRKRRIERFEELRDGRIMAEALQGIDPNRFFFSPTLLSAPTPLPLLLRVYHSLLSSPASLQLSYLPCPDLEIIASYTASHRKTPPSSTNVTAQSSPIDGLGSTSSREMTKSPIRSSTKTPPLPRHQTELLHLLSLSLLALAVYGRQNELVIQRITTHMNETDQRIVKEVIEECLGWIEGEEEELGGWLEEDPSSDDQDIDEQVREEDLIGGLGTELREIGMDTMTETDFPLSETHSSYHTPLEHNQTNITVPSSTSTASHGPESSPEKEKRSLKSAKKFYLLQKRRREIMVENESLKMVESNLGGEVESLREELEELKARYQHLQRRSGSAVDSTTGLPIDLDNHDETRSKGKGMSVGQDAVERKILMTQLDRLREDLGRKDEDLKYHKDMLEEKETSLSRSAKQLDDLKKRADEADKLKDDLQVHKHVAEDLRKSENLVEKLKKKLDDIEVEREKMTELAQQNLILEDINKTWEARYKELHQISRNYERTDFSEWERKRAQGEAFLSNTQAQLALSQAQCQELSMELQQKNQRLAELFRESSLKEELEMEQEGEKRKEVARKSGMQELARDVQKLLLGAQTDDGMTEEHKSVEGVHSIADQLSAVLQNSSAGHQALLSDAKAKESIAYQSKISNLELQVAGLKHELHIAREGKMIHLKAWQDLNEKSMKTGETGQPMRVPWLARQRYQALQPPSTSRRRT